jgi:hypothetical protein
MILCLYIICNVRKRVFGTGEPRLHTRSEQDAYARIVRQCEQNGVKSKIVCKMGRLETVAPKPFLTPSLCEI